MRFHGITRVKYSFFGWREKDTCSIHGALGQHPLCHLSAPLLQVGRQRCGLPGRLSPSTLESNGWRHSVYAWMPAKEKGDRQLVFSLGLRHSTAWHQTSNYW